MFQPFTGEGAQLHTFLTGVFFHLPATFQLPAFPFRRGCGIGCYGSRVFGYGLPADRFYNVEYGKLCSDLLLLPLGFPPGTESLALFLRETEEVIQGTGSRMAGFSGSDRFMPDSPADASGTSATV